MELAKHAHKQSALILTTNKYYYEKYKFKNKELSIREYLTDK